VKTIESVEEQVERLLDEDALAAAVKYGLLQTSLEISIFMPIICSYRGPRQRES
jgi:hypothetical protein